MRRYTNLNKFVKHYKVFREQAVRDVKTLQERLSNVPINLAPLEEELGIYYFDLISQAELYQPDTRIFLLDEVVEWEEANNITEKMVFPISIINFSGIQISDNFFNKYRHRLGELIIPDQRDKTSRVLSDSNHSSVAITYERQKGLHYIEMILRENL